MQNKRFAKAQVLIDAFKLYCSLNGLAYLETGIEMRNSFNGFMDKFRNEDNDFLKVMRYFPDFVLYNKQNEIWLIDIKNSLFIEKDAYESYCKLKEQNLNVGIVFSYDNDMQFARIENIRLKAPNFTDCPIQGVWCMPRLLSKEKYDKWKQNHSGSGTPFSVFDIDKMFYTTLTKETADKLSLPEPIIKWNPEGTLFDPFIVR